MVQSANQILHQLEAANAATQAANNNGGVNNTIVSGYSSSSGSFSPLNSSTAESMASMDEYSTSMDFSDLANEEALDSGKGEGAAGGYGKANYEVLRLDATARARRFFVRRRDLLREHRLQPRDLRRIDPSIDFTKTSPSITIKEDVLLLNLGGVRAIVTAEKALLFEPNSATTRKFLEVVAPRLQTHGAARQQAASRGDPAAYVNVSHADYMARFYHQGKFDSDSRTPPFELEVLEGALTVAVGRLDAEMAGVTERVSALLTKLPGDITPVNLEELRRVKQALVELENKADTLREMLEELMDDEDELRELNLSSRPRREDRRRQRERNRLEREVERAREIKEELEERALDDGQPITAALPPRPPVPPPPPPQGGAAAAAAAASGMGGIPGLPGPPGQGMGGGPDGMGGLVGPGPGAMPVSAAGMGPSILGPGAPGALGGAAATAAAAAMSPYSPYGPQAGPAAAPPSVSPGAPMAPPPQRVNGYYVYTQQSSASTSHMSVTATHVSAGGVVGIGVAAQPGGARGGAAAAPPQQLSPPPGSVYPLLGPYSGNAAGNANPARQERLRELRTKYDRDRLRELRARFGWVREGREDGTGGGAGAVAGGGAGGYAAGGLAVAGSSVAVGGGGVGGRTAGGGYSLGRGRSSSVGGGKSRGDKSRGEGRGEERERERRKELIEEADYMSRLDDSEEDLQEAQDALEEMVEEEEEEAELEEVEDLLEFYLQRASALQSEAERMLAGARDLEESIGVSLSARRYEVNRLELMLSIGSFAAAIGAMLAGIFGMNMRSNLEQSMLSFWGISAAIVLGCAWIFFAVMRYTRSKRIL